MAMVMAIARRPAGSSGNSGMGHADNNPLWGFGHDTGRNGTVRDSGGLLYRAELGRA
jgi:hypothetical protein